MEILDLGGAGEENIPPRLKSRKKTKLKVAVGIGSLAAVTGLGSTLAASITLNSDSPVEFGQGVATTAACDTDGITLTPTSEYLPSSESFRLSGLTLSGINTATPDPYTGVGCAGKILIVHAYTDDSDYSGFAVGGNTANPLYFSTDGSDYYNDGIAIQLGSSGEVTEVWVSRQNGTNSCWESWNGDCGPSDPWDVNNDSVYPGTAIVSFGHDASPGLDSRAVSKFTVESIDNPANGLGDSGDWYALSSR